MTPDTLRRWTVTGMVALGVLVPLAFSGYIQSLASDALWSGLLVLSLVVLTGLVGQVSFCQYSFAAIGAFTVGSLTGGHHWSFWISMPLGIVFAAVVGVLVGIPALRLSGLFLAILTVAVALFFDQYLLSPGTWNAFTGGLNPWEVGRPSFLGISLKGEYAFYLFSLGAFLVVVGLVWNLQRGKVGRVLRAVRGSELAASTMGLNLTSWKLAAFGLSAAIAGLAGALSTVRIGSVSAGSYAFLDSVALAAVAIVMGVDAITAAVAGGVFLAFGHYFLHQVGIDTQYFNLIVGALLVVQLVFTPKGLVPNLQQLARRLLPSRASLPPPGGSGVAGSPPPTGPGEERQLSEVGS